MLTEKEGRRVFWAKAEVIEATPERLRLLEEFRSVLTALLAHG